MIEKIRLDRFISNNTTLTRTDATKAIKSGTVHINGQIVSLPDIKINPQTDEIYINGEIIEYKKYIWIMLNKPQGVISATKISASTSSENDEKTVLDLLPPSYRRLSLFPCGRLDKNTLGLIILTNDGVRAHQLLAPKSGIKKVYKFHTKFPISSTDKEKLEKGVIIILPEEKYTTAPCEITLNESKTEGEITLTEGKYHQIKLMMQAVYNQITYLERISFAGITLDLTLNRGEWKEIPPI